MKKLYEGGRVITMDAHGTAEAVLTENGKILRLGTREELRRSSASAQRVDLCGAVMLPAFIDSHGHFSSYASSFLHLQLAHAKSFAAIGESVRAFIEDNAIKPGEWVIAEGYDNNSLQETRHPTLELLDACAPRNPLFIRHASGHAGVMNTAAQKSLGITPETPAPEGGQIGVSDGRLTGYVEENAFFEYIRKVPGPDPAALAAAYAKAQASYAAHGITTIQEGMAVEEMIPSYQKLIEEKALYLDLVAYPSVKDAKAFTDAFPKACGGYDGRLRIGGLKIFLDGSPQARTAWMRAPYEGGDANYRGYPTMTDAEVSAAFDEALRRDMQLLAHCNGDAAAEQFIRMAVSAGVRGDVRALRPVMIHAQLLAPDQLEDVKRAGIILSFFPGHIFRWGDAHVRNFGMERARRISPAASALQAGIRFTFHQDTPVTEPDMLLSVWCAVNRVTQSGTLLGAEERISAYEALRTVTANAAYQYFEEDRKGSIAPGKNADFVLLEDDPTACAPERIRDIRVCATIKDDRFIFGG